MTILTARAQRWGAVLTGAALGAPVALVVLAGPAAAVPAGVYDVTVVAGLDGSGPVVPGPAVDTRLNDPTGVEVGPDGSLYIVNNRDYSIYRVDSAGQISRFAGTGARETATGRYVPTSGVATAVPLYDPLALAFAPDGTVYIADGNGGRVIKVDTAGNAATFAGSVEDSQSTFGGYATPIPAIDARLNVVSGIAVDSLGNVYATSQHGHRVDKITPDGQLVTWVGYGSTSDASAEGLGTTIPLDDPRGLAVDPDDNLYIADTDRHRVHRVTPAGMSTFFAGDGTSPVGVFTDGPAAAQPVRQPNDVGVDEFGDVVIATDVDVVYYVDTTGYMSRVAGAVPSNSTRTGPALDVYFDDIDGIAFGPRGVIYVTSASRDRVSRLTPAPVVPDAPTGVTVDSVGDGTVTLSWTAPAFAGFTELTGFVVTPYLAGVAQTPIVFDSTDTTQVLTGLVNGGQYTFEVAATNSVGESAPAEISSVASPQAPVVGVDPVEPDRVVPDPVTGPGVDPVAAPAPAPAGPVLAATGASVALPIGVGAVLLLAGGGALAMGRRHHG